MPIKLLDYQLDAIERTHVGSILCGSTGSGKSLTGLGYYYMVNGGDLSDGEFNKPMVNPKDLYIITTPYKRDSHEWEQELTHIAMSPLPKANIYENKVVIDSWNNIQKYIGVTNAFFIFDEQKVIGKGAWAKAFIKITKKNSWILLSATPGDSWSDYVSVFIANGFLKNRTEFNNNFVEWSPYTTFPSIKRYLREEQLTRWRDAVLITMAYKPNTVQHHTTIMCQYDKQFYKQIFKDKKNPYKFWEVKGVLFQKPIESGAEFSYILRKIVSSDPDRQKQMLAICDRHPKVIVFYTYDYERDILLTLAYPEGTTVAEHNGHEHDELPDTDRWVYLVQYSSGCEGWNCTTTDTMIFFSPSYSYKSMEQAAGRIDRRTTPYKDLYYYHLESLSSIEISIRRALSAKKDFNGSAFGRRVIMEDPKKKVA